MIHPLTTDANRLACINDATLTPGSKIVYLRLVDDCAAAQAESTKMHQDEMAAETALAVQSIRKYLRALELRGVLHIAPGRYGHTYTPRSFVAA